ncbi:MAG: PH domain-containing protein [Flavobacteriales bacterium]|nr:PH domain-containing protein [Flavobacteriales bacterium]
MEGVLSEETDSQTIRVNFDSVVEQDSELLGIFYQRVSSKKFFSKWSERFFMLRRNKLIILKRKSDGRPKYSTSKFIKLENCSLSGVTMEDDKIIFKIYYKNKRVYKFGTTYMDVFTKIYSALDRRIYNTKNLLSEDNLDDNPN